MNEQTHLGNVEISINGIAVRTFVGDAMWYEMCADCATDALAEVFYHRVIVQVAEEAVTPPHPRLTLKRLPQDVLDHVNASAERMRREEEEFRQEEERQFDQRNITLDDEQIEHLITFFEVDTNILATPRDATTEPSKTVWAFYSLLQSIRKP